MALPYPIRGGSLLRSTSMTAPTTAIRWHRRGETRFPFGPESPDPARWTVVGFPPPWPERPWIFGVMVASANGVVAWRRRGPADDPVPAILGHAGRPERLADMRHMRLLRAYGDVSVGARTVREQPALVLTPEEPGHDEPAPELYRWRTAHGLSHHPRNIVYSPSGRLPLAHPMFTTPGVQAIAVTTRAGAAELTRRGAAAGGLSLVVEPSLDTAGLRRAHERLRAEFDVRYLACEGGATVLHALLAAGLLDELFLTRTDVVIDVAAHDGVLEIFDVRAAGAELVDEGTIAPSSAWLFQRWRLSRR
jgi:riboflavin biosynthesis pyrimidine reductase